MEEKQKKSLLVHYSLLIKKIDIGALLPHLVTMDLLTDDDKEVLMNIARTLTEKIHHLVDVLPRKDGLINFWSAWRDQLVVQDTVIL